MVLAVDQGAHAGDTLLLEARDERVEQLAADAALAQLGIDLDGEPPARRRLAEFPGTHLARDEAGQRAFIGFGHQEMPLRCQHLLPVSRLVGAGQPRIQRRNRCEISGLSRADRDHIS